MTAPPSPDPNAFRYVHSGTFPALLHELGVTLAVSTYQAGKLMLVRSDGQKLNLLLRSFEQPMGLALESGGERLAVGTRRTLWILRAEPDIGPQLEPKGVHDGCWVPRVGLVTGALQGHEIGFVDGKPWMVNTLFSCLCTHDDERYTFVPRWRPPFVSRYAPEDRCHLNGLAMDGGRIRTLSALGATDTERGWKPNKVTGGVLLDHPSGEIVVDGLCMPHSPRWHHGKLWVCNSGRGELAEVDPSRGEAEPIVEVPGYTRGLDFAGRFAFVGLSQIRESNIFGGLPLAERCGEDERRCGVYAIDLEAGRVAAFLQFEAGVQEIFAVTVLPSMRWPALMGFQGDGLDRVVTAPPETWTS